MGKTNSQDWYSLYADMWDLGLDVTAVVWMRSWRIAAGGPASALETERMIAEKVTANIAYAELVATGQAGLSPEAMTGKMLGHYGKAVRANRRRLSD